MVKHLVILGLSLLGGSVSAFVTGCEHLYNPQTNVIVDILYDFHVPEQTLFVRDMEELPFFQVKRELFQTERRVLDALDVLNRNAPGMVDVIWEDGIRDSLSPLSLYATFINYSENLVRRQFRNLTVISSDICRAVFEWLLLSTPGSISGEKEVAGISFRNLMPISDEDIGIMLSQYGDGTWDAFDQLRTHIVTVLFERYVKKGNRYQVWDNEYHALADCEMLRNILSSRKPHVILYCGGWHSARISEFLIKHAGFNRIGKKVDGLRDEIDVKDLAFLDEAFRTVA